MRAQGIRRKLPLLFGACLASILAAHSALATARAPSGAGRTSAREPAGRAVKVARVQNRNGPVELVAVNGNETLALRLRDEKGRPLRGVQKRFDHFLRCHHTNTQHAMNPRLVRVIYQVGRHFPGRRVEVVSGYRHPSVAKNPRSPHMKGLACDFRVAGVKNADLRDYLRRGFEKVGVGYYPNSSFVHLDVRKDHSAFWIDYSGPGERATYSEDPSSDLKTGRADSYKPTKIDTNWVAEPDDPEHDATPPGLGPVPADENPASRPAGEKPAAGPGAGLLSNVNKPVAGAVQAERRTPVPKKKEKKHHHLNPLPHFQQMIRCST